MFEDVHGNSFSDSYQTPVAQVDQPAAANEKVLIEDGTAGEEEQEAQNESNSQNGEEAQGTGEGEDEDNPLLFVDVNLGSTDQQRIVIYEGDTA